MTTTSKPKIEPRKPGSVQAAAGFISGGSLTSATDPSGASAGTVAAPEANRSQPDSPAASEPVAVPASGKKAAMSRKRTGVTVKQLTVYLPPEIEKQLRVVAAQEDRLPSDVVAEALRIYFSSK